MAQQQPDRRKTRSSKQPVSIPDKLYFRIGEVSRLCSLPSYVLRFWETEFPQLKPNKGGTGQRLYRKRDVEMVLEIKHLLYDEGFTIAGARRLLTGKRRSSAEGEEQLLSGPSTGKPRSISSGKPASREGVLPEAGKTSGSRPSGAKMKELRQEMRELLTLLGSSEAKDRKPQSTAAKQETKKPRRIDEPTLF